MKGVYGDVDSEWGVKTNVLLFFARVSGVVGCLSTKQSNGRAYQKLKPVNDKI